LIFFFPSLFESLQMSIVAVGNLDWNDMRDILANTNPLVYHLQNQLERGGENYRARLVKLFRMCFLLFGCDMTYM
jgi:hypothetical protein